MLLESSDKGLPVAVVFRILLLLCPRWASAMMPDYTTVLQEKRECLRDEGAVFFCSTAGVPWFQDRTKLGIDERVISDLLAGSTAGQARVAQVA